MPFADYLEQRSDDLFDPNAAEPSIGGTTYITAASASLGITAGNEDGFQP